MNSLKECKTIKARKEFIKTQLLKDDRWLLRGLLAIYKLQTAEEQQSKATTDHNGVGFTGIDGQILSSFAEQVIKKGAEPILRSPQATVHATAFLTPKQVGLLKAKMPKYAGQLLSISKVS